MKPPSEVGNSAAPSTQKETETDDEIYEDEDDDEEDDEDDDDYYHDEDDESGDEDAPRLTRRASPDGEWAVEPLGSPKSDRALFESGRTEIDTEREGRDLHLSVPPSAKVKAKDSFVDLTNRSRKNLYSSELPKENSLSLSLVQSVKKASHYDKVYTLKYDPYFRHSDNFLFY